MIEISSQELEVFIAEADELIQLLDENILRLESEGSNPKVIQDIFRAAHTLKGSSSMLGLKKMAEVTHAMESLLDKVRNNKITINSFIIDTLLNSLDAIKELKRNIEDEDNVTINVNDIVLALQSAASSENGININHNMSTTNNRGYKKKNKLLNRVNRYTLEIKINSSSSWKAVRCFQIIKELESLGNIIKCEPTLEEIEDEKVKDIITIELDTSTNEEKLLSQLKTIEEIDSIAVLPHKDAQNEPYIINKEEPDTCSPGNNANSKDRLDLASYERNETITSIRVNVNTLDKLMNLIEELVIDHSRITETSRILENKYRDDKTINELRESSTHIVKILNELYADIQKVRMIPISQIFNKYPRLVRDLSHKQGKKVNFIMEGSDTELDRTIVEKINDPLIHMIRNAVDHGVETVEQRRNKGKNETATIKLSARQEEANIIITLSDDGNGIDPEKIKMAAIKKGCITQEQAVNLTDSEAVNLIFQSGMSTVEKATEISGRGVGMDIVRANIEKLHGSIQIDTKINEGTTFTVKLPLTLALFRGLMISVNRDIFIIPIITVVEVRKVLPGEIYKVLGKDVIRFRERVIPIIDLSTVLGLENYEENTAKDLLIIVKVGELIAGIIVDQILKLQEFVIKPVGNLLYNIKGIAGASILGNGETALILDIPSILRKINSKAFLKKHS